MSLSKNPDLVQIAKTYCRDLRKNSTQAEKILWESLRNRKLNKVKFYRQFPIYFDDYGKETFYIADFYSRERKLIIELDGKIHEYQAQRDSLRTSVLSSKGLKVLRYKNDEIEKDLKEVLKDILKFL